MGIEVVEECAEAEGREVEGPLSQSDLIDLWNRPVELFSLANGLRLKTCGDEVSYIINRNINFSNRCLGSCRFCAFRAEEAYTLSDEEVLERVYQAHNLGATEICVQGGLVPGMAVEDYCHILRLINVDYPKIHLHACSPMEVLHISRNSGVAVEDALRDLRASGLGSMPGTAAEVLVDSVRAKICPEKLNTMEWCRVVMTAHRQGIPTTSTLMYGHVESMDDRLAHLQIIRRIQERTGGITEFVLLPFMPMNNLLGPDVPCSRRLDLLDHFKMHALARVALYPFITNIQASWTKLGRDVAGATLEWGVNDLGGTLMEENISRSAGSHESQYLSPEEFVDIIESHGRKAVQRTTLYKRASNQ